MPKTAIIFFLLCWFGLLVGNVSGETESGVEYKFTPFAHPASTAENRREIANLIKTFSKFRKMNNVTISKAQFELIQLESDLEFVKLKCSGFFEGPGESITQYNDLFFYLSKDKKNVYLIAAPDIMKAHLKPRLKLRATSKTKNDNLKESGEKYPENYKSGDIFRQPDGTWKNY